MSEQGVISVNQGPESHFLTPKRDEEDRLSTRETLSSNGTIESSQESQIELKGANEDKEHSEKEPEFGQILAEKVTTKEVLICEEEMEYFYLMEVIQRFIFNLLGPEPGFDSISGFRF